MEEGKQPRPEVILSYMRGIWPVKRTDDEVAGALCCDHTHVSAAMMCYAISGGLIVNEEDGIIYYRYAKTSPDDLHERLLQLLGDRHKEVTPEQVANVMGFLFPSTPEAQDTEAKVN